ncbi:MAG: hypothetical protein KDD70_05770, partial [Bdellovibrionales bacterium]|nr:hypothetical protein [Bdellovibrionales bacterium]
RSFFRVLLSKENLRYDWLILSLSVGFTGFVNLYYLYFIALFGLTIGSAALLRFRSKVTRNVIGAACCTLLGVVLCSYKLYLVTTAYLSKAYSLDHESGSHAANLLFFFLPSENQLLGKLADFSLPTYVPDLSSVELGTYLGLGLFLFLICGLRLITQNRECRWMVLSFAAAGVFFVFLSLGPTIRIAGFPLIPNSIFLIFNDLPFFPSVPIRIGFLAVLLFYCLAASVISRIPRASAIGVLAIMLVEQFPVGLPIGDVPQSQAVASLKSRTDVVAVHDFAVGRQHKLARQLEHRKSVTKAFVARAPIAPNKSYRDNVFLRYVRKSESVAAEASRSEVPDNKALEQGITALDIQAVICETGKPKVLEAIQQSELFDELARDDGFVVYVKR